MGSWHGCNIGGFAAQIPKVWSGCLWALNVACWTPVSKTVPWSLGAGRGGLVFLALPHLSPGRGHSVWSDTVSLPSSRRKATQTIQGTFSIVNADFQSELDRCEKKCCFTSESQIKSIAYYRFLLLSFIYYCDISVLCICLLLLGVSSLHISFAQMASITLWRMIFLRWKGMCARSHACYDLFIASLAACCRQQAYN